MGYREQSKSTEMHADVFIWRGVYVSYIPNTKHITKYHKRNTGFEKKNN